MVEFRSPLGKMCDLILMIFSNLFVGSAPHMHCFGLEILKDHLKPGIDRYRFIR